MGGVAVALTAAAMLLLLAHPAGASGTPYWATEGAWLDYEMDLSCTFVSPVTVRATLTDVDASGASFRLDWPPGGCASQTHYVPWDGDPADTIYYMDPELSRAPGVEYGTITPGILGRTKVIGPAEDPQTNYDAETGVLLQLSMGATLVGISFEWPAGDEAGEGSPALDLDADGLPDTVSSGSSGLTSRQRTTFLVGGGSALALVAGAFALSRAKPGWTSASRFRAARFQPQPSPRTAPPSATQESTAGPIVGGKGYSVDAGRWVDTGAPGPPAPPALAALFINQATRSVAWIAGVVPQGIERIGYRITEHRLSAGGVPMTGAIYDLPPGATSWKPVHLPPQGPAVHGYQVDVLLKPAGGTAPPTPVSGGYLRWS